MKNTHGIISKLHWRLLLTLALIIIVLAIGFVAWRHQGYLERGSVNDAVEMALSHPGQVRDDLIGRGLFIEPRISTQTGETLPGEIKIGEIEKLIKQDIYAINQQGELIFGSSHR